jgi:hypothetical protein
MIAVGDDLNWLYEVTNLGNVPIESILVGTGERLYSDPEYIKTYPGLSREGALWLVEQAWSISRSIRSRSTMRTTSATPATWFAPSTGS